MKKIPIALFLIFALCGCKGRTASTPVPSGDTVEVVINADDPAAVVDAESDSLFSVTPADEETGTETSVPAGSVNSPIPPKDPGSLSGPAPDTHKRVPADAPVSF